MMIQFAVIGEGSVVENIVAGETLAAVQEVFAGKTVVEYSIPSIGGTYVDGKFILPANTNENTTSLPETIVIVEEVPAE
jgi:hypothetical protein